MITELHEVAHVEIEDGNDPSGREGLEHGIQEQEEERISLLSNGIPVPRPWGM
jgi:hypothetical protein